MPIDSLLQKPVVFLASGVVLSDRNRGPHHANFVNVGVQVGLRIVKAAHRPVEHCGKADDDKDGTKINRWGEGICIALVITMPTEADAALCFHINSQIHLWSPVNNTLIYCCFRGEFINCYVYENVLVFHAIHLCHSGIIKSDCVNRLHSIYFSLRLWVRNVKIYLMIVCDGWC